LISPDGKWVLSARNQGRVEIPTGRRLAKPTGPNVLVEDITVKGVAAASNFDKISLWDIGKGRLSGSGFTVENYRSGPMRFSADGRLIAIADETGRIQLMDVATRSPLGLPLMGTYVPESSALEYEGALELAFSADGSLLHVVDAQHRLRTHVIGTARIKQLLCQETGPFDPSAWKQYMPNIPYRPSC
jgi:hypothetical protein